MRAKKSPRLDVRVTDKMLRDVYHCPMVAAIKVACAKLGIKTVFAVNVGSKTIRFSDAARQYTYHMPRAAQRMLAKWDQGGRPEAISFTL